MQFNVIAKSHKPESLSSTAKVILYVNEETLPIAASTENSGILMDFLYTEKNAISRSIGGAFLVKENLLNSLDFTAKVKEISISTFTCVLFDALQMMKYPLEL